MLVKIADAKRVGKKTYNNIVSVLRRGFEHGYRDHPERHNPARSMKTLRMRKKDRPPVDPFCIEEAEALITAIHQDCGEGQGNYDRVPLLHGTAPIRADRAPGVRLQSRARNYYSHDGARDGA